MRRSGEGKDAVESATGSTIGVYDVDFEVYRGEIFVVIGLSGSGKSTLLRLLNRLIEPTEGEVYLDGQYISQMSTKQIRQVRRSKMGMVFQHFGLLPNRSVLENVTFGLEVQGVSGKERRKRGGETLEMVGLQGQGNKRITELSGGMQQRVGLARALATEQEILLMDEPFSALDPLIRRDMQSLFLDIQDEIQRTVVFITHDLDEALRLGHRAAIMRDGEIVQVGTPEEILADPADEYVERFIEGVDCSKVRTAENVMVGTQSAAREGDTPQTVLEKMREAGLGAVPVVDDGGRFLGLAREGDVARLAERGEAGLLKATDRAAPTVRRNVPLRDLLPRFTDSEDPVAVTDETGKLEGVVHRRGVIAGLSTGSRTEGSATARQTNPDREEVR